MNINPLDLIYDIACCYIKPNFEHAGVECLIVSGARFQTVAVRGSEDVADWIANAKFFPMPHWDLGHVHYGFWWGAWRAFSKLKKRLDIEMPVVLAGHSKGGPEAILLGYYLQRAGFRIAYIETFGAPQFISKGKGRKALRNLNIRQTRNGGDVVPLLPLEDVDILCHARELNHIGDKDASIGWENFHAIEFYRDAFND